MAGARDVFFVCDASELDAEKHAVLVCPSEGGSGGKRNFHRVPIRAAPADTACTNSTMVDVPGGLRVAPNLGGLRRVHVKFPESYCHSIKEYDTAEGERTNLSLGFAL